MMDRGDLHCDVLIVGAGPAGSSCASFLARKGLNIIICDKAAFPRDKICGDCINPSCWELFHLLGVADEVAAHAELVSGVRIAGRNSRALDIPIPPQAGKSAPFAAIKRSILDDILLKRATADGVLFLESTALDLVSHFVHAKSEWKIELKGRGQVRPITVFSKILIGADGRNSRVARLLEETSGRDRRDNGASRDRIGLQFKIKRTEELGSKVLMFFFDGGYGGIVGVSDIESNVAMVVSEELARLAESNIGQFLDRTINANEHSRAVLLRPEIIGAIQTAYPITPMRRTITHSSAYLVGDARRTTEPFTGEGIFFAMQDGFHTAQKIAASFSIAENAKGSRKKNRFVRDALFSPILRNKTLVEKLIGVGIRHGTLARLASRVVLR